MRKNPATGLSILKNEWEDQLTEKQKADVEMWRNSGLPPMALTSRLITLLDEITNTQGGQLALIRKTP